MNMDKAKRTGEELLGKAKEATGKVTGNKKLETEGKTDQLKAKAKKLGDDAKDALGS